MATKFASTPFVGDFPPSGGLTANGNGALGGFQAGLNYQAGAFVLGAEADFSFSGIKGNGFGTNGTPPAGISGTTIEQKIPWFDTVRGRLGLLLAERLLVFATGGAAFGDTKVMFANGPSARSGADPS